MTTNPGDENRLLALSQKPGFEGLKGLAEDIERIGKKKLAYGGRLILPNLFLSANVGYDLEMVLSALECELEKYRLMDFSSQTKHYEFSLDYSDPREASFPAFSDLFEAVETELSRFNHAYEGILVIDITEWVVRSATAEKKFLDFLHYMSEVDERTLAIYVETSGLKSHADLAYRSLITKTRLERIELKLNSPEVAYDLLCEELEDFGFAFKVEARKPMLKTLKVILDTKGNEGPWTIHILAEDIVYNAFKTGEDLQKEVGLDLLKPFLEGGEWLTDFADKKRYYLGLVGE